MGTDLFSLGTPPAKKKLAQKPQAKKPAPARAPQPQGNVLQQLYEEAKAKGTVRTIKRDPNLIRSNNAIKPPAPAKQQASKSLGRPVTREKVDGPSARQTFRSAKREGKELIESVGAAASLPVVAAINRIPAPAGSPGARLKEMAAQQPDLEQELSQRAQPALALGNMGLGFGALGAVVGAGGTIGAAARLTELGLGAGFVPYSAHNLYLRETGELPPFSEAPLATTMDVAGLFGGGVAASRIPSAVRGLRRPVPPITEPPVTVIPPQPKEPGPMAALPPPRFGAPFRPELPARTATAPAPPRVPNVEPAIPAAIRPPELPALPARSVSHPLPEIGPDGVVRYPGRTAPKAKGRAAKPRPISVPDPPAPQEPVTVIPPKPKPEAIPAKPAQEPVQSGAVAKEPWEMREEAIAEAVKASKESGSTHLDDMPLYVEEIRGRRFKSLRDGSEWVAATVDNNKNIYFVSPDGTQTEFIGGSELGEFVLQPANKADAVTAKRHNKAIRDEMEGKAAPAPAQTPAPVAAPPVEAAPTPAPRKPRAKRGALTKAEKAELQELQRRSNAGEPMTNEDALRGMELSNRAKDGDIDLRAGIESPAPAKAQVEAPGGKGAGSKGKGPKVGDMVREPDLNLTGRIVGEGEFGGRPAWRLQMANGEENIWFKDQPDAFEYRSAPKPKITRGEQGATQMHAGVSPLEMVKAADDLDIPSGSFRVERTERPKSGRDYDVRDRFLQPIGVYDAAGKPIQKGAYDRLGVIVKADGTTENVGTQVGQRMKQAQRAIDKGVLEADQKLEKIEKLVGSTVDKSPLSPFANRKATKTAFEDFVDLAELPFDDPKRIAALNSKTPVGEALKVHDEMTEGFRKYIIEARKEQGIDTPDDWGITEQGYFRHLFLGDIRVFVDGKMTGTARTYAEAQGMALDILKANPNADIVARARNFFGGDPTLRVSTKRYFKMVSNLAGEVEIPKEQIMADIRGIVGRKAAKQKFAGFLQHRKGTEGYSKDYLKVMQLHGRQVYRTQELSKLQRAVQPLIEKLASNGKPGLAKEMEAHMTDLWGTPSKSELEFGELIKNTPVLRNLVPNPTMALRQTARLLTGIQTNLKLKVSPRSALINLVQPFSTLWPYVKTDEFLGLYRELAKPATRKMLVERGVVQGTGKLESPHITQATKGESALNPFGWFRKASETNRSIGYLHGLAEAKRLGLNDAQAHDLGLAWAEKVEFDNSTWNVQPVLRSPQGRVLGQFKSFTGKNLENLREIVKPDGPLTKMEKAGRIAKWGAAQTTVGGIRSLGLGAKVLGGVTIVAFLKKQLQANGMEEKEAQRWAEAAYYGAPSLIGQDLSASVMILEAPYGNSWEERAANWLLGPSVSMGLKSGEALSKGKPEKAFQYATPAFKPYTTAKNALQGKTQTIKAGNKEIPLTGYEAVMRALGFTPLKQTRYYDERDQKKKEPKASSRPRSGIPALPNRQGILAPEAPRVDIWGMGLMSPDYVSFLTDPDYPTYAESDAPVRLDDYRDAYVKRNTR